MIRIEQLKSLSLCILIFAFSTSIVAAQTAKSVEGATKAYKQAHQAYEEASLELERASLRSEKRAIVKAIASFTPDQDKAFWPVYDKYEAELVKLNNARISLIKNYAEHYDQMTDAKAKELTVGALDLMQKRLDLKKTYVQQLQGILPATTAARLLQLENQVDLLVDLDIASEVPLIE